MTSRYNVRSTIHSSAEYNASNAFIKKSDMNPLVQENKLNDEYTDIKSTNKDPLNQNGNEPTLRGERQIYILNPFLPGPFPKPINLSERHFREINSGNGSNYVSLTSKDEILKESLRYASMKNIRESLKKKMFSDQGTKHSHFPERFRTILPPVPASSAFSFQPSVISDTKIEPKKRHVHTTKSDPLLSDLEATAAIAVLDVAVDQLAILKHFFPEIELDEKLGGYQTPEERFNKKKEIIDDDSIITDNSDKLLSKLQMHRTLIEDTLMKTSEYLKERNSMRPLSRVVQNYQWKVADEEDIIAQSRDLEKGVRLSRFSVKEAQDADMNEKTRIHQLAHKMLTKLDDMTLKMAARKRYVDKWESARCAQNRHRLERQEADLCKQIDAVSKAINAEIYAHKKLRRMMVDEQLELERQLVQWEKRTAVDRERLVDHIARRSAEVHLARQKVANLTAKERGRALEMERWQIHKAEQVILREVVVRLQRWWRRVLLRRLDERAKAADNQARQLMAAFKAAPSGTTQLNAERGKLRKRALQERGRGRRLRLEQRELRRRVILQRMLDTMQRFKRVPTEEEMARKMKEKEERDLRKQLQAILSYVPGTQKEGVPVSHPAMDPATLPATGHASLPALLPATLPASLPAMDPTSLPAMLPAIRAGRAGACRVPRSCTF